MASKAQSRLGLTRLLRENSLSIFFFALFLAALVGQAISGHSLYNQDQLEHHQAPLSLWRYLGSSHFAQGVMENWQSEYLQFALFALAGVWLLQRGSPESKELDKPGLESDREQKVGRHAEPSSPRLAKTRGRGLNQGSLQPRRRSPARRTALWGRHGARRERSSAWALRHTAGASGLKPYRIAGRRSGY